MWKIFERLCVAKAALSFAVFDVDGGGAGKKVTPDSGSEHPTPQAPPLIPKPSLWARPKSLNPVGLPVAATRGCNKCHALSDQKRDVTFFIDNDFHNIGIGIIRHNVVPQACRAEKLIDSGDAVAVDTDAIESDLSVLGHFLITKKEPEIAAFKTPGLCNVLVTAPYFQGRVQLMKRNTSLKTSGMILGLLIAATAAAQMTPYAAEFMHAMDASMKQMDRDMAAAPMNGDVDHDFATMMMPHHQGAIDMAKAELRYGKDPVMRRLAQEILVDQQSEIDAMQLWLTKKTVGNVKKDR
jgi:hypothetical protein